jgi:predicted nucleic acid-binding protein
MFLADTNIFLEIDAYQFQVAEDHQLSIVTMDKDFNRVRGALEVVPIP